MSKRRIRLIVGVCAVLAIAIIALVMRNREPSYQGKSLSDWLGTNAFSKSSPSLTPETQEAIRHMGTNALPFLVEWVHYYSYDPACNSFKKRVRSFLPSLPYTLRHTLTRWADRDEVEIRSQAAQFAFEPLGDLARPAIPELSAMMNQSAYRDRSVKAILSLGFIGKTAIPALSDALENTNAPNRRVTAGIFGWSPSLVTNSASVLPLLVRCLNDPNMDVRAGAAYSLGKMAAFDPAQATLVVPALTNCLTITQWSDASQRVTVIDALGAYGALAKEATPLLFRETKAETFMGVFKLPDPVRIAATNALLKISPEALENAPSK